MERNLELNPSEENIRDSQQPPVVKFQLDQIKQHFDSNILEIKGQFDFYLHEITKYGLANIFEGQWDTTPKYKNIKINMELIEQVLHGNVGSEWFVTFVYDMYAKIILQYI